MCETDQVALSYNINAGIGINLNANGTCCNTDNCITPRDNTSVGLSVISCYASNGTKQSCYGSPFCYVILYLDIK